MGVVDYDILNQGSNFGAASHVPSHFAPLQNGHLGPYSNGQFAPYSTAAPANQWMEPYLNLVASQHNASVSHHSPGYSVLEIESSGNALTDDGVNLAEAGISPGAASKDQGADRAGIGGESTTTMGAVTLIAFLNLLGYIQSVLIGTGRRKRRSLDDVHQQTERSAGSVTPPPGGSSFAEDDGRGMIPLPPIPTFFDEVVRGLGFWQEDQEEKSRLMASRRVDRPDLPSRRVAHKEGWAGFFTSLGQRFRLAANLMGFLSNPGPSRVRRSLGDAVHRAVRSKRFTSSMNAWYDDLRGVNYDNSSHGGGGQANGLLSKLMLGLGRGIFGL